MKKLNFFLVSFFFLILTAVLNAEPEIVVLKDTLSILKEQYKHLSPIYGCVWYKSPVIESMYRFGDPKDASIQLIKKLFYLNQDNVNFSEMQSSTEIATYFTPQDIGGVVGIVEKYFGEEKKDIDKKAFEGELDQYFAKPIAKAKEKLETIINSEEAALKELKPLKQKIDSQKKDFQAKEKALKQAQKDINFFSKRNEHLKEWEKEFEKYVEELKKIDEKDKKLVKQVNQLKGKKKQVEQRIKDLKELSVEKIEELKTEEPLLLQECETLSGSIKADEEQFKRLESKQTELYLLKEKAKDLGSAIKTLLFSAAQSSDDNIYLKHTVQNMLLGLMWAKSQFKKDLADYLTGLKSVLSDAIFEKSFDEKAWEENVYTKEEYKDLEELAKSDLKTLFSDKEKVFFLYFGYDVFKSKIPPKLSFRNDVSYTFEREGQELIVSQIPDCGETTLRNFFNLLLYDAETKTFQVNRLLEALDLKREDVDHESPFFIPLQFYDHYNAFYKTASHASQQSVEAHNHWMTVVANWPGVVYNRGAHLTGGQPLCEISSQYYKGHGRYGLENMNNLVTTLTGKNLKELFQAFFVKVFKKEEIEIGSFWQEEESADNETIINFIVADSVFSLIFYPGHFEINFPKKVFPIEKDSLLKTISLSEALTKNDDFTLTMLSLYVPFDPTIEVSDNGFEQCPLLYQLFRNKDLKVSEATYYHLLFSHELRNYQVILSIFGSILLRKDINSERKQGLINRFYKSLSGNDNHTQAIAVGYFIEYDKDFFKNIRKYELSFLGNIKALTEIFTNDRFLASAKRIEDIKNSGIWQCLQDFVDNKEIKELADSPYNDQICNLITRVLNVYKQDLHQAEEFKNLLSSFVQKILRSVPLSTSLLDKIRYYLKEKVDFGLPMIRIIIDRIKENPYPLDKGPLIAECIKIIDAVFSPRAGLKESQISQKNSFLYELVEQLSQEKNEHGDFDDAILAYDQIITDDESLNFEQKNSEIKKMYHLLSSKFEAQKKSC